MGGWDGAVFGRSQWQDLAMDWMLGRRAREGQVRGADSGLCSCGATDVQLIMVSISSKIIALYYVSFHIFLGDLFIFAI